VEIYIVLALVLVVAGTVATSIFLTRRRRRVWRAFAGRRGLRFETDSRGLPRVRGRTEGRNVELSVSDSSSDTGLAGIREEILTVSLDREVPAGLRLRARARLAGEEAGLAAKLEGKAAVLAGTARLEDEDEAAALRWLDGARATTLHRFLSQCGRHHGGIEKRRLYLRCRRAIARAGDLEERLTMLLETARRLTREQEAKGAG
jgi:hypothetical protein